MKNYKILENRPELTKEQLTQGMNFNKVKTNAALAKTAVLKSFIVKCILGAAVIGSGVFVYKMATRPEINNNRGRLTDSVKKANSVVVDSIVDTDKKNNEGVIALKKENKKPLPAAPISIAAIDTSKKTMPSNIMSKPVITEPEVVKTTDKQIVDSTAGNQNTQPGNINNQKASGVIRVKSCKIWNTNNFCNTPKTARFATSLDCDLVDFDYIDCQTANQKSNVIAVWLTIGASEKSTFQIESNLKNIRLVNANGKSQTPLMLSISGENRFLGENFKARRMTVHYNKQIDVFLFFQKAKVGDKIMINNLIEALIEQ